MRKLDKADMKRLEADAAAKLTKGKKKEKIVQDLMAEGMPMETAYKMVDGLLREFKTTLITGYDDDAIKGKKKMFTGAALFLIGLGILLLAQTIDFPQWVFIPFVGFFYFCFKMFLYGLEQWDKCQ